MPNKLSRLTPSLYHFNVSIIIIIKLAISKTDREPVRASPSQGLNKIGLRFCVDVCIACEVFVQIIFSFWSFEISEGILRNKKKIFV